jgi:teichuronic acid biosynthesis glycosyltransferase TuaC
MPLKVLMITNEWPTPDAPYRVPFIKRQADALIKAGIDLEVFSFEGRKNPARYLEAWMRVRRKLRDTRYDLVHAQFGQSAVLALPKRVPLVVTFRGSDLEGYIGSNNRYPIFSHVLRLISKLMARAADEVILVSERLAQHIHTRSYHVVPSGLDLDLFKPHDKRVAREKLNLPLDTKLVLFAANPSNPIKRFDLANAAVEMLKPRMNVELVATKNVPYPQMPLYMNACDALILTSTHEGSPNVVKEALACNLRVVALDVGDIAQRLGSLEGCVLCPNERVETLAAGLEVALNHPAPFDGRSTVIPLDENLTAARVIDIYRCAVESLSTGI